MYKFHFSWYNVVNIANTTAFFDLRRAERTFLTYGKGKAKDSVVHSHVHVALSDLTSHDIKALSGFDFEEIELKDLALYKSHSYLLVKNPDNEKWIINNNPEVYIPRQYVRQLIAEEYGIQGEAWNWRTHPFVENAHQCAEDIKNAVEADWTSVPPRVKQRVKVLFNH